MNWISIVETSAFIKRAEKIVTDDELDNIKELLAENPEIGDLIRGSGGIRKVRVAAQQKGKSGGARVIYYFYNETIPLFLLDIYAKSEKIDLKKTELEALRKITEKIRDDYGG